MTPNGIVAQQVVGLRPAEILAAPDHLFLQNPERYEFFDITDITKRYVIDATGKFVSFVGGGIAATIGGTYAVGSQLTLTMQPGWGAAGVQWTRDGIAIPGATATVYVVAPADNGHYINCVAINLSYIAAGGLVGGITSSGYDGGNAFTVFPGDAITGGDSGTTYSIPPISGGSA